MFHSNVFSELGEAIGNIGRKLFSRRGHADELDAAFRRHLQDPLPLALPLKGAKLCKPDGIVIEGVFRVIEEEKNE